MIDFDSVEKDSAPVEQIVLFKLDGVEYKIDKKPKMSVALKYLKISRDQGSEASAAYLLEKIIGEEGYEALTEYEDLTAEQFQAVVQLAQEHVLGGLEAPKGK